MFTPGQAVGCEIVAVGVHTVALPVFRAATTSEASARSIGRTA